MARMSNKGLLWTIDFQNLTKMSLFFMIGEMAILFSVYGERTYLFSLICDLDPPFSLGKKCRFFKDPRPVSYPCQSKNSSLYIFFNSLSKKGFLLAYSILYNVCMH